MPQKPVSESADYYFSTITNSALQETALALRYIIKQALPAVQECIKWGLPFYMQHGNLCYINIRKQTVELGFYRGVYLSNGSGLLVGEGKLIRHVVLSPNEDLPKAAIIEILQEAVALNQAGPLKLKR